MTTSSPGDPLLADDPGRVGVVGHRGACRDRPENTIASFDAALVQGCDAIELDLQLSADGIPVVYHDRTLEKAGLPERRVADLALAELRQLDAGSWFDADYSGESIPTLDEVLDLYATRTRLLIELKPEDDEERNRELVRAAVARIETAGIENRIFVLSFSESILETVQTLGPRLRRVRNLRPPPALGKTLRSRLTWLSALCVDVRALRPSFGRAVRGCGTPLWVYTCNEPRQVERALEAEANAVISDRPGWLTARLSRSGHR